MGGASDEVAWQRLRWGPSGQVPGGPRRLGSLQGTQSRAPSGRLAAPAGSDRGRRTRPSQAARPRGRAGRTRPARGGDDWARGRGRPAEPMHRRAGREAARQRGSEAWRQQGSKAASQRDARVRAAGDGRIRMSRAWASSRRAHMREARQGRAGARTATVHGAGPEGDGAVAVGGAARPAAFAVLVFRGSAPERGHEGGEGRRERGGGAERRPETRPRPGPTVAVRRGLCRAGHRHSRGTATTTVTAGRAGHQAPPPQPPPPPPPPPPQAGGGGVTAPERRAPQPSRHHHHRALLARRLTCTVCAAVACAGAWLSHVGMMGAGGTDTDTDRPQTTDTTTHRHRHRHGFTTEQIE